MAAKSSNPEMFFFPFVGGGHQIPMIDIARLFASHGVQATIVTTPTNALSFQNSIHRDQLAGHNITIHAFNLPAAATDATDMAATPFTDTSMLREPLQLLLQERQPDCIVVDMFHRWAADAIDGVGILRITFNGNGCFSRCAQEIVRRHKPYEMVSSDSEMFLLPGLPDEIELTRSQIPIHMRTETDGFSGKAMKIRQKTEDKKSFGVVVNSFYELEPAYVEYLKKEMGQKAWLVGPVSLCNRNVVDKTQRGQKASIDEHSCLSWLDSKEPNSVLYVSFGSLARLVPEQLLEIAYGLQASNCSFIWAVGKTLKSVEQGEESWVLGEFQERMEKSKKGLMIKGWAPQLLILGHAAVGGFMTHCGWNSTIEGVSAGVPMITWPLSAEQFYNEKLITNVSRIGVCVGSVEWISWNGEPKVLIKREKVTEVVESLMSGGEEVTGMRRRARELAENAKRAVEKGGSSYLDVEALIEELKSRRNQAI